MESPNERDVEILLRMETLVAIAHHMQEENTSDFSECLSRALVEDPLGFSHRVRQHICEEWLMRDVHRCNAMPEHSDPRLQLCRAVSTFKYWLSSGDV